MGAGDAGVLRRIEAAFPGFTHQPTEPPMTEHFNDIAAVVTTAILFMLYFWNTARRGRKAAYRSVQALNHAVRDECLQAPRRCPYPAARFDSVRGCVQQGG